MMKQPTKPNVFTDAELTKIYNEANGLDPKRHNPITTERIFKAMRACLSMGEPNIEPTDLT